jgi:hypothetical protein
MEGQFYKDGKSHTITPSVGINSTANFTYLVAMVPLSVSNKEKYTFGMACTLQIYIPQNNVLRKTVKRESTKASIKQNRTVFIWHAYAHSQSSD